MHLRLSANVYGEIEDAETGGLVSDFRDGDLSYMEPIIEAVNNHTDLLTACQQLENALAFALTGHPLPNTATIIESAQAIITKAGGWMGIEPSE